MASLEELAHLPPGFVQPPPGTGSRRIPLDFAQQVPGPLVTEELAAARSLEFLGFGVTLPDSAFGPSAIPGRILGPGCVEPGAELEPLEPGSARPAEIVAGVPREPPQRPARACRTHP